MSENSKIQWTTHTYNPWIGCTKVSPGCANCYAESEDKRRGWTPEGWGKGKPRKRTKTEPDVVKWNKEAEGGICPECGVAPGHHDDSCDCACGQFGAIGEVIRSRVFCSSLADWLDDEVPIEWLADLLDLIRRTPNLDWLLLTKRPENWRPRLEAIFKREGEFETLVWWLADWLNGIAPNNVWLGTSVEDQQRADERIPVLLSIPAKIRFLSCEPLLEAVDLKLTYNSHSIQRRIGDDLHWVIVGGESGRKSRPFDLAWARSLRDQCQTTGTAFFMKQMGAVVWGSLAWPISDKKGGNIDEFPEDLRIRQFPQP